MKKLVMLITLVACCNFVHASLIPNGVYDCLLYNMYVGDNSKFRSPQRQDKTRIQVKDETIYITADGIMLYIINIDSETQNTSSDGFVSYSGVDIKTTAKVKVSYKIETVEKQINFIFKVETPIISEVFYTKHELL